MGEANNTAGEDWFAEDVAFLRGMKERGYSPGVVFDVGASTGVWSEKMQGVFPEARYHLFEPLAEIEETYHQDLTNRLRRLPNLTLHPVALAAWDGSGKFFVSRDAYGSSLLDRGDFPEVRAVIRGVRSVPVRSLDSFVAEQRLPFPDLIKLDCQGGELAVLKGATECLKHAKVLLLETWLSREYGPETPLLSEIAEWLYGRDFALVGLGGQFRDSQRRLYSIDGFFLAENLIEEFWPDQGGAKVRRRVLAARGLPEGAGS